MAKAERLAEAALELAVTDAERTDAFEALAEAENGLIRGDLAWRYFLEAIDTCERVEPYDGLRVADLCARACELPQRFPGSMHDPPEEADVLAVVERGFSALPDGDSKPRVQLLGLRAGWAFAYPDDERTDADLEALEAAGIQAAETALRLGLPNLASGAYDQANGGWISRGRYDRAERTWRMRRDIMPEVTSVLEIGDFYAMGAWLATGQGRYDEAIDLADEGVRQVGDRGPNVTIHNRCWKIQCYKRLGRWDEALAEVAIVRALLEERQDLPPGFASAAYAIAGAIHARRGERIDSDRLAQIVDRIPGERAVRLYPDLVEMDIARGDVVAAGARPIPFGWQTAGGDTLAARARLIAAAQTWEEAPALLAEMRAMAAASPWPELDGEIARLEGRSALATGDRAVGLERLVAAAAAFEALGCAWELAVTDLELAEAGVPDATRRAATAAATFERLRTPAFLTRARAVR
jgi:tetratricopeptide (TPR) repeat protein